MTRTRGVVKARREPTAGPRKPVTKDYGATSEYGLTAYERERMERRTPTGAPLPGAAPAPTVRRGNPSLDPAGLPGPAGSSSL